MWDASKLNVYPSTVQNASFGPELKDHGEANVAVSPTVTNPAKIPLTLCTVGMNPPWSNQPRTCVAVLTVPLSNSTPPANVIALVGKASACWTQNAQVIKPSASRTKTVLL